MTLLYTYVITRRGLTRLCFFARIDIENGHACGMSDFEERDILRKTDRRDMRNNKKKKIHLRFTLYALLRIRRIMCQTYI